MLIQTMIMNQTWNETTKDLVCTKMVMTLIIRLNIQVKVAVGHCDVIMDLDTGASCSTISETVYRNDLYGYPLIDTNITLRSYMGELLPILGCAKVPVKYPGNPEMLLELVVVQGTCPCLLGRDWLSKIKLDWENIFSAS